MAQPIHVAVVPKTRTKPESEREVPRRLADVLRELPYLPHWTAVLGVCRDGVPYLWDLHAVSSLLVLGEGPVLPRQVLDAVRRSLEHANPTPHFLEILWVTERGVGGGITRAISPHDRGLEKALLGLADLADGRAHGRLRGSDRLLLIDDLAQVLQADHEAVWALEHLVRHGGRSGLHVLAGAERQAVRRQPLRAWVKRFKGVLVQAGVLLATGQGYVLPVEVE